MERGLILLMATVMVFMTSGVRGTDHLSFDNTTAVNITRDGCGVTKLCFEEPENCDPTGSSSCQFSSINASMPMPPNGTDLSIELSGNSTGYIAIGLTANVSEGTTLLFICAQDNGTFFFRTMLRNNTNMMLTPIEQIVSGIRSSVIGNMIQCEFIVEDANATSTRTSDDTTFAIILGSGSTDGTTIGALSINRTSMPVDVTDPSSLSATPTPATNMTTSGVCSVFTPHVFLLLSVLALSVLKTI